MKKSRYLTSRDATLLPKTESFFREKVKEAKQMPRPGEDAAPGGRRGASPKTEAKYRDALHLYTATNLSTRAISEACGVTPKSFQAYLRRYHREEMLARHNIRCGKEEAPGIKLCHRSGQTPAAYMKYRKAIAACDDTRLLEYNVSQIARFFKVDATALGNQLRRHYPEILRRREQERARRGIRDNYPRGARRTCEEQYAAAIELLHEPGKTIHEAAEACNVSESGLREHLLYYHRELSEERLSTREQATRHKRRGQLTGNGQLHTPTPAITEHYRKAVELYAQSAKTVQEIATETGVSANGLRNHIRTWHRELMYQRRGADYREGDPTPLASSKRYLKSTAEKYAGAIDRLKKEGLTMTAVAAEFGLQPENLRKYLKEHEPELHARLGKVTTATGKLVSSRSMEKYREAIRLYQTTPEKLKSIAARLGLPYNSLGKFIRRNFPERRHEEVC